MPTSMQRAAIAQFMSVTGSNEKTATRLLKNTGYKLNEAIEAFYSSGSTPATANMEANLKAQFKSLRNNEEDTEDTLGATSSIEYFSSIGVNVEDATGFLGMHVLGCENVGEIREEEFLKGWREARVDGNVGAQKQHISQLATRMPESPELFKKVYQHAFLLGRENPASRNISKDTALAFWEVLFQSPGWDWVGKLSGVKWFAVWAEYIQEKQTRPISKDAWNQTLQFAIKSAQDETLSFWSEDGAWATIIDSFVSWYREKHPASGAMEVDA